jgi:peptidoglycan/xylan/chitin deacetylase (PgdA/CDA1 family)
MTLAASIPSTGLSAGHVPDTGAEYYLHERYRGERSASALMAPYYAIKPLLPRSVQLWLRRRYARRQAQMAFPRWPIEPVLIEQRDAQLQAQLQASQTERLPFIGFWPEHRPFACVLTHDVEGPAGVRNIERVLEVERRHGFVSSWNFVAEWYDIPDGMFDLIRASGGEIGLHGIKHDGRLFSSRAQFESNLPTIHRYLEEWDVVGFRSPATHRNAQWMHELGCLYDSSFPDSDPFEPRAGGCCSIFPFMFGDVVELPITLLQDHTLMQILKHNTVDRWQEKADWIIDQHGLINLITHPDYLIDPEHLAMYDAFLGYLAEHREGWFALPRTVAEWWRQRSQLTVIGDEDGPAVCGHSTEEATLMWARDHDGTVVFEL